MTQTALKKRSPTFDLMKFIGIILVVIGHMTVFGQRFIFSFHMPLFFIIGGYFYRERELSESIHKDTKRLILPYLLTALTIFTTFAVFDIYKYKFDLRYWAVAVLYGSGSNHNSIYFSHAPSIGAIWFLLALFWCKTIFNYIYNKTRYWLYLSFGISIIATIVDYFLINLPFAILPGASAVMYYAVGFIIKQKGGFLKINPFIWVLIILFWITSFLSSGTLALVQCEYPHFIVNVIGAFGGTYVVYLISHLIATYQNKFVELMTWGGAKQHDFSLYSSL